MSARVSLRAASRMAALLALVLCAPGAAADELTPPPVYLQLEPCVPVQPTAVRQALAVEFGALYTQTDELSATATRVTVGCADAQLWLRLEDPRTGRAFLRRLDLWTVDPSIRARLLGLSIAELVNMSWTEFLADAKAGEPAWDAGALGEPLSSALIPARRLSAHLFPMPLGDAGRLRLTGVTAMTAFFSGSGLLWGGGLHLGFSQSRRLGWAADLIAQHSDVETSLGQVSITAASASAALLHEWRWPRLALHLGGGFRGGVVHLVGRPQQPERVLGSALTGAWGGPLLTTSVSVRLPRRLVVEAGIEGGVEVICGAAIAFGS